MNYLIYYPDLEAKTNSESEIIVATHSRFTDIAENITSSHFSELNSPEFNHLENFAPEYSSKDVKNNSKKDITNLTVPETIFNDASFSELKPQQKELEFRDKKPIVAEKKIINSSFLESNNNPIPENENKPSFSKKGIEIKNNFKLLMVKIKLKNSSAIASILVSAKQDNSQTVNLGEWLLPYNEVIKILKLNITNLPDGKLELITSGFVTHIEKQKIHKDSQLGLVFSITDLQKIFNINAKFDSTNNLIILDAPWFEEDVKEERKENVQANENYIIPPRTIPNNQVKIFTTTIPLNGRIINHLSESEVISGLSFGDAQNTTFDVNAIFRLNSQITENLTKDNIFTVEQTGSYLQLQMVRTTSESTINIKEPKTLIGTQIQLSLIASCTLPGANPDSLCAYTPSLVTEANSLNPQTLFPTKFLQPSKFGEVVTQESFDAIKQPGFQLGENGQQVGLDLLFPNVGSTFENAQSNKTSVARNESIENRPAGFYSTVRQVIKVNDTEAVIGRTVRGFGLVLDDKNISLNTALQLSHLIFPDAEPEITGGVNPPNKNINRNLFFAANNAWIPANSFTIYHAGIGRALTPKKKLIDMRQAAAANFESMWFGFSPVTKRTFISIFNYELTSPSRMINSECAEGGSNSNIDFSSSFNGQNFSTQTLNNFYSQVYLTIFNQDANLISSSQFTEKTSYVPHLSIGGNITGAEDIFRYYGGILAGDNVNAYLGLDYTKNTLRGLTYSVAGIAYTNPDYDYYSNIKANLSQKINLSKNSHLLLSTGLNYAFDRDTNIGGIIFNSPINSVILGARANMGNVSFGLLNYFGGILPDSIQNTLRTDLTIKFNNNFILSGYYTPINESLSRSRYGMEAKFKLGENQNSPILSFSWNNNEYKLGTDSGNNNLGVGNNTFTLFLKGNF
ncbi:hypothetical protein [Brunnivagina elsteri]|uniref:Uncharacterized protein n=1 Tax=Brunnivagina elsteri CCALA 953 TaxID=987040 RepID=A0A2A2TDF8_9CYAN|nr:hypothetical protein [Calothrix elsteri]PAX51837.1 hypothetical protein CK510_22635 [Calothrix elsteri CCALA 953]